uniref:alpha-N-acetylgalactosaminide alpha-2,6-sialyltransferase n=1 Tax=Paramormyrops kingsleyae TaxID=1676925 RepID=A0A3B3S8K3_9TELE|nr:alpha-N-acetylgalactosaminide alpha-2,6-sialyltransferase 1-like [Paramormyrops kingsleyae]XP_023675864.1 alpha-N-acetylgalactosaminide alpha-2,6-sialyltransferase 1-like [Paramormyrops kingsleyae]XP_023675873.1 alpha-N-acetylgalactosaminide alpha-2,6-sialyltransferase 1-like [Paramormyrops kingsleyae]XP_023675881.1 alpha-N-acetylgalactosaminide alpha-2,6-sialyltransferase 1-like [Paramormyrops kingsleyae]XP_023675889.1 alpha-N-acetylgalactosaminide alpha-2,6-sialyltransferase 1-like [Paramo
MTARKVLPLTFAVLICLLLYAFLWQHITTYNIRRHFYHAAPATSFVWKYDNPASVTEQSATFMRSTWKVESVIKKNQSSKSPAARPSKSRGFRYTDTNEVFANPSLGSKTSPIQQNTISTKLFSKQGITEGHQTDSVSLQRLMFKEAFVKMPKWEFEDLYVRDASLNQTSCPKSLRKNTDPEFKKAFISDVRLFMQPEDLNRNVWNRLSHFNNPFGFMGYMYKDVKEAVDLIPKLKSHQLLPVPKSGCIRCAVVGTSGILNGSRMGQEIDSHDYVFRMNGAIIKGYEEDVGNKTSVYVHTSHSILGTLYELGKYGFTSIPTGEGIKYVFLPEGLRDFQWLHGLLNKVEVSKGEYQYLKPWMYYPNSLDLNRFYVLHPDFLRYVKNRFMRSAQLETTYWHFYRPTNGAFTLFLALQTCDVVDAYGFITANHSQYPNYYFEKIRSSIVFYINHDYNLEIKLWEKLHDAKVIRLYKRKEKDNTTDQFY